MINPYDAITAKAEFYPVSSYELSMGGLTAHWSLVLGRWQITRDDETIREGSGDSPELSARRALMEELQKIQQE